jgi:Chaperonin 10 Kd subunit
MARCVTRLLSQGCDAGSMLLVQYKTVSPVGNRVFVKVDNEEATSAGGILLPTSAQKKPTQGEVVSLGDAQSLKVRRIQDLDIRRLLHL